MALAIDFYVHGVPMGQDMFGTHKEDQSFIGSFYGPKWDAPELLRVDVRTFGEQTYCYYTFVKGENLCDSQGRAGSYFALTLRINAYYADIQNIYSILKAIYSKMCIGLCVKDYGTKIQYLVSDFNSIAPQLKNIEHYVLDYLSQFSVAEDIVSINGLKSNSNQYAVFNLHECNKETAYKNLQYAGGLKVSPYYPSSQTAQIIERYNEEKKNIQLKSQQEFENAIHDYEKKLSELDTKYRDELESHKKQSDEALKKAKENADKQSQDLRSQCEKLNKDIVQLSAAKKQLEKENRELESQLQKRGYNPPYETNIEKKHHHVSHQNDSLKSNFGSALKHLAYFFIFAFVAVGVYVGYLSFIAEEKSNYIGEDTITEKNFNVTEATESSDLKITEEKLPEFLINWKSGVDTIGKNEKLVFSLINIDSTIFDAGAEWKNTGLTVKYRKKITNNIISLQENFKGDSCLLSLTMDGAILATKTIYIKR